MRGGQRRSADHPTGYVRSASGPRRPNVRRTTRLWAGRRPRRFSRPQYDFSVSWQHTGLLSDRALDFFTTSVLFERALRSDVGNVCDLAYTLVAEAEKRLRPQLAR
jgi:hypothetical protein